MQLARAFVGTDGDLLAHDDSALVDFLVEEEGGETRLGLPVDDGEVDGGCATVLGQEGCREVEGASPRHLPHHGGQHPEGHHDEQVSLVRGQLLQKRFVSQLLGLQQRQTMRQGDILHVGILYLPASTGGLVGHGDDDGHFIAGGKDGFELRGRKFWGAEIGDSEVLFHIVKKNPDPKARIRFVNHECR